MAGRIGGYLNQLLNIHWLRPETALWRSFDCVMAEYHAPMAGRSIDLGCGDGTLSYIMAGGCISHYDVFRDVGRLHAFNEGEDIYDIDASAVMDIDPSGLRYQFDVGVDHKGGLINKANQLGEFYTSTRVQDLNQTLPFEDGSFDSAFSNILYWLEDLNVVLSEWRRILSGKGQLVLFVPGEHFREKAWLYYSAPHRGNDRYLNYFDRGYAKLIHHCYSAKKWNNLFETHGFEVQHHQNYLTDPVMEIWNIGMRPVAPLLIQMANKLAPEDRECCKAEWVEYFTGFLKPLIEGELESRADESQCAFHFYVLKKQSCM